MQNSPKIPSESPIAISTKISKINERRRFFGHSSKANNVPSIYPVYGTSDIE